MSRHKSSDLLLIIVLTAVTIFLIYYGYGNPVSRTLLALPLVLFLPGYTALAAINPRTTLRRPEFILLSIGMSLAVTGLLGLLLNWTSSGLQTQSWSVALGGFTLIACLIGLTRRREILLVPSSPFSIGLDWTQQMLVGLAVVIAAAAFIIARQGALQQPTIPFTQLWLFPPDEARPHSVRLGIHNQESATLTYRLKLVNDDQVIQEWDPVDLKSGEKWEVTVELPEQINAAQPLEALLYRQDSPGVIYRQVLVWIKAN